MRRSHSDGHGLHGREQEIMDLNETGVRARAIAEQLGIGKDYVRLTIGRYHFGKLGQEMTEQDAATRAADVMFQQALAASGGRFA